MVQKATVPGPRSDHDLLWKYYIKNFMFFEAARFLLHLAEGGEDFDFHQRLDYLSRALSAAKSMKAQASVSLDSELLTELEEKMEVAYIQQQIYGDIKKSDLNETEKRRILAEMDSGLFDVTYVS